SYGEVSTEAVVPLSRTFDHLGPFARTVADVRLVYRVLAGLTRPALHGDMNDHRDADNNEGGGADLIKSATSTNNLRVGIPRGYLCDLLDVDVRAQFDE